MARLFETTLQKHLYPNLEIWCYQVLKLFSDHYIVCIRTTLPTNTWVFADLKSDTVFSSRRTRNFGWCCMYMYTVGLFKSAAAEAVIQANKTAKISSVAILYVSQNFRHRPEAAGGQTKFYSKTTTNPQHIEQVEFGLNASNFFVRSSPSRRSSTHCWLHRLVALSSNTSVPMFLVQILIIKTDTR